MCLFIRRKCATFPIPRPLYLIEYVVRRNDRNHDHGPFPLCHPDFLHSNIIVDDSNFDVLGIIDWEGACTLPLELVCFPRFLKAVPRCFGRSDRYGADGQPHDTDEQQRWRERHEYVQMVVALEALERGPGVYDGGDHTLSAYLADEHAQNLSYAMEAFECGKMGFYDQLLDDLERGLPWGGGSLQGQVGSLLGWRQRIAQASTRHLGRLRQYVIALGAVTGISGIADDLLSFPCQLLTSRLRSLLSA